MPLKIKKIICELFCNKQNKKSSKPLIPHKQIPRGIKLCLDNAERLITDAKILDAGKRYSTSLVLSILAYEEIGKVIMLRDIWLQNRDVTEQEWNEMQSHETKSTKVDQFVMSKLHELVKPTLPEGAQALSSKLSEFKAKVKSKLDKEAHLYVNWNNNTWTNPLEPRMQIPDSDSEHQLQAMSSMNLVDAQMSISYVSKEDDILRILREPDYKPMTEQDVINFIREKLNRQKNKIGIETQSKFGEIKKIKITWIEPLLTNKEKKMIRQEIGVLLPQLKEFVIKNVLTPKT